MSDVGQKLTEIAERIVETYKKEGGINRIDGVNLPATAPVVEMLDDLMEILFPGYFGKRVPARSNILFFVQSAIDRLFLRLLDEFKRACQYAQSIGTFDGEITKTTCEEKALALIQCIPAIRSLLKQDINAGFEGDPASKSLEEIISCYPYVYAIAAHRIAHEIYRMDIPLIPRIMSEWAHRRTGIDIHPGAVIGRSFFIDHGTGVVVGETTEIGDNVKIYQGVTLGALSFKRHPDGTLEKSGKRHPTIKDDVTIYSGATILGGETVIGEKCVIGANTWITSSVAPGTLVSYQDQQIYRAAKKVAQS
ncbi:serine acetyltransferase [candidate division KSB1 bacterium]|nr:serine acetyltransferase [candidate division KSB1 bacterium]RQW06323.1 MAG: serine acetyltransferase [candidate division KSB1 bacterium]